jgi:DNA-binding transcriptional LysR family regulator
MLVDQQLAAAGRDRRIALEVNDVPTLLELVANGLGVALVPEVVTRHPADVRYLRLRRPRPPSRSPWPPSATPGQPGRPGPAHMLSPANGA